MSLDAATAQSFKDGHLGQAYLDRLEGLGHMEPVHLAQRGRKGRVAASYRQLSSHRFQQVLTQSGIQLRPVARIFKAQRGSRPVFTRSSLISELAPHGQSFSRRWYLF
jgi:hypothetical protein